MKIKNTILFLLFLIIPAIIMSSRQEIPANSDGKKGFDSTAVSGYQFFKSKGIVFDSLSNIALYNELYAWFGVPYQWGGKSKLGADCSGFASAIYKNVYAYIVGGSAGDIYKMLSPVEKNDLKEGDLVFFKIGRSYISHVGIYLSNNKFIHETSWGHGVMISDLNESYYKTYYFSAGRIPSADINNITVPSDSLKQP